MAITWFTSDLHFHHTNVLEFCDRGVSSVEEMNEGLIANWNDRVGKADMVYCLGDFCFGGNDTSRAEKILSRLNGQKQLICGNHDRKGVRNAKGWSWVGDYKEIKLDLGGEHRQKVTLCHYAMRTWNYMHHGAWMLHGHSHGNLHDYGGKIMDVGVDANGLAPVSMWDVDRFMRGRKVIVEDHHGPRG